MSTNPSSEYLSVKETAAHFGKSVSTVHKWIRKDKVPTEIRPSMIDDVVTMDSFQFAQYTPPPSKTKRGTLRHPFKIFDIKCTSRWLV